MQRWCRHAEVVHRCRCKAAERCRDAEVVQTCRSTQVQVQRCWCLAGTEVVHRFSSGDHAESEVLQWCRGADVQRCRCSEMQC